MREPSTTWRLNLGLHTYTKLQGVVESFSKLSTSRKIRMDKGKMRDSIQRLEVNKRLDGQPIGIKKKPKRLSSKQIGFMKSIANGVDRKTAYK